MKIGVFDSGLGGLSILKSIHDAMPDYDYIYLGDTLHVPYGRRSAQTIRSLTTQAVATLTAMDCQLIIIACNTACAYALRDIQQNWLPNHAPDNRILGVIVPTLEAVNDSGLSDLALLATNSTIASRIYHQELAKLIPNIQIKDQAAPLLVPLMENDGWGLIEQTLKTYLAPYQNKAIQGLILGCTHYGQLAPQIQAILPECQLFSQNIIIPQKLQDYLTRNHALQNRLSRNGTVALYVTDMTDHFRENAAQFFPQHPLRHQC